MTPPHVMVYVHLYNTTYGMYYMQGMYGMNDMDEMYGMYYTHGMCNTHGKHARSLHPARYYAEQFIGPR